MHQTENVPFYAGIPFLVIRLIGNLLVIRIVHKIPEMHTPTNYLLVSMAISDVVTILLWPVYYFEFAKFVCKFAAFAEISIMVSSNTPYCAGGGKIPRDSEAIRNRTAVK